MLSKQTSRSRQKYETKRERAANLKAKLKHLEGQGYSRAEILASVIPAGKKRGGGSAKLAAKAKHKNKVKSKFAKTLLKGKFFKSMMKSKFAERLKGSKKPKAKAKAKTPKAQGKKKTAALCKDGHLVGKTVRIVDELAGKALFGLEGQVNGYTSTTLEQVDVQRGGRHFEVATVHVEDITDRRPLSRGKTLKSITKLDAQRMLDSAGFGTAESDKYRTFRDELAGVKSVQLQAGHISLFWKFLQWSHAVDESVVLIPPDLIGTWLLCNEQCELYIEAAMASQKQASAIRALVSKAALLLVPIWSNEVAAEHWTLLAVDKPLCDQPTLRYYDTLKVESFLSRSRASEFVSAFIGQHVMVPARRNKSTQGKLACGFTTCWYIEEELRHHLNEGWAARRWVDEASVRMHLHALAHKLGKEELEMRKAREDLLLALNVAKARHQRKIKQKKAIDDIDTKRKEDALQAGDSFYQGDGALPPLLDMEALIQDIKAKKKARKMQKNANAKKHVEEASPGVTATVEATPHNQELVNVEEQMIKEVADQQAPSVIECSPPLVTDAAPDSLGKEKEEQLEDEECNKFWEEACLSDDALMNSLFSDSLCKAPSAEEIEAQADALEAQKKEVQNRLKLEQQREHSFKEWANDAAKFLTREAQWECDLIRIDGLGICSKCRWTSGCAKCTYAKAVRYWFKVELNHEPPPAKWEMPSVISGKTMVPHKV